MKTKKYMEIVGILSLSLLITSTMAVSGGVPEMIEEFTTNSSSIYTRSTIELMMSVPGFSIMIVIALTPVLTKYIKERIMISSGLLLIGTAGLVPFFTSSLPLIFASRIFLGIGIGLVNTLAVTLIGERFSGDLRQKLQGMRCSMETLGEASLIFIAGQLLVFGWNYSFLVYGFAFVILALYLIFVPETPQKESISDISSPDETDANEKLSVLTYLKIIKYALLGLLLVSTLSSNALRISSFIVESGFGTAVTGSTVLSASIFAGFIGGLAFGKLLHVMSKYLLCLSCISVAGGFLLLVLGGSLTAVLAGASICGFFTTIALSHMFNALSDNLPTEALNTGNAMVLVGCNLGGILSPFILKFVGFLHPSLAAGFLFYGTVYLIIGLVSALYNVKKK